MLEYEAVLTRPENLKEAGATREDVGAILDALGLVLTAGPHSVFVEAAFEEPSRRDGAGNSREWAGPDARHL